MDLAAEYTNEGSRQRGSMDVAGLRVETQFIRNITGELLNREAQVDYGGPALVWSPCAPLLLL